MPDNLDLDRACDEFEVRWKSGQRPRIEDFLAGWEEPGRQKLLRLLLETELEWRREKLQEQPTESEYRQRFPANVAALAGLFDGIERVATLAPGMRLGAHEIVRLLGEGGMGRVYLAYDSNLGRQVALKVLQPRIAQDPEWVARFNREARLLASMKHPNIAPLHNLEEVGGIRFLVMEFVEGPTLDERIKQGPLSIEQALAVCREIALALEYAHARGVIHRDLKPANIKVGAGCKVKVLDFGLAKSTRGFVAAEASQDTVEYQAKTAPGALVGTLGYISPEQISGDKPDDPADEWAFGRRGDLWAFGCILYEALAGKPTFTGKSNSDVLAAVIKDAPDWKALPDLPPRADALIRRCLEKDPQRRQRDAGDARLEIEQALEDLKARPAPQPSAGWSRRRLVLAAALMTGVFVLGTALGLLAPSPKPTGWTGQRLLGGTTTAFGPRLSPDGQCLAFSVLEDGQSQVGVMKLDSEHSEIRTHDRKNGELISGMCWSRDSQRIFYDRFIDVPGGIFSVERDGPAKEVLVLADGECAQETFDGNSLVVCKLDCDGNYRLYRHWPKSEDPDEEISPPLQFNNSGWPKPVRALRTKDMVVFCAKLLDGDEQPPKTRFYQLDFKSKKPRPLLDRDLVLDVSRIEPTAVQIAISPDDRFLYTVLPAGDLYQFVKLSLNDPAAPPEPLFSLTLPAFGLEVGGDNVLYLDQFQRSLEVLRVEEASGNVTRMAASSRGGREMLPVELPGGRVLLPSLVGSRELLLASRPEGKDPAPLFLKFEGETAPPAVLLDNQRLAVFHGSGQDRQLKIATLVDDHARIVRSLKGVRDEGIGMGLSATLKGDRIYYVQGREVYEVRTDGTEPPKKIAKGDGVAAHPVTGDLLVQRFEKAGVNFYLIDPVSGKEKKKIPIPPKGKLRPAPSSFFGRAIDQKGRALIPVASPDDYFWRVGRLDLETGVIELIETKFDGDTYAAGWSLDEKSILIMAYSYRSELWKVQRQK
jgi:eukaryotic-like serine/threonine-protein kinase